MCVKGALCYFSVHIIYKIDKNTIIHGKWLKIIHVDKMCKKCVKILTLKKKENCTVKKDNSSNHYYSSIGDEILDMAIIEKFDDMM